MSTLKEIPEACSCIKVTVDSLECGSLTSIRNRRRVSKSCRSQKNVFLEAASQLDHFMNGVPYLVGQLPAGHARNRLTNGDVVMTRRFCGLRSLAS